jgi:hypothetical protein
VTGRTGYTTLTAEGRSFAQQGQSAPLNFSFGGANSEGFPKISRYKLRLNQLVAAQARSADAQALGGALHLRTDGVKIHIPTPLGDVVSVADVIPKLRPFAAHIANLCHGYWFLSTWLAKT